ncbi:PAS domain S-box protein [Maridesulfovibrio zosterae]|uniref:PAS domain S-box protein n=1 Tax=Maridesulfovibrio zosterae TaxID=82171 RepID=UPI0003FC8540|nr:PAS domain S-box protein [Maridesulfovibrio zosterae]
MEKKTEIINELRSSIGRLEAVLSSIDEAILWTDSEGKVKWCNDSFARLIGQKRIFIMGKTVTDFFPLNKRGQKLPAEAHPLSVALRLETSQQGDYTFGPDNIPFFIKIQYLNTLDGNQSTVITARDSSKEKELADYRIQGSALAAAADAIVILDKRGKIHWANKAFTSMTGYEFDEIYGDTLKILKSGHHSKEFYAEMWDTILSGSLWIGEMVNKRKTGEIYYEEQKITPVRDSDGKISNFIAIKTDITEKRLAQKSLEDREAKLSALFNGVIDAIVTADSKGDIITVNPAAEKIFGYEHKELVGKNVRQFVPPELRPHHDSFIKRYLTTRIPKIIGIGREIEAMRKDGTRFPIELSINEIITADATMFTAIVRDISERKRQEHELHELNEHLEQLVDTRTKDLTQKTEELIREIAERKEAERLIRQSSELLRSLLDGIYAAFLIIDLENRTITELNEVAESMFGFKKSEIIGYNCDDVFASQGKYIDTVCPRSYEGEPTKESVVIGTEGTLIPVTRHVLPITLKYRPHLAVILFDIAERKNLERKLAMAQKLESIGRLASGVAHEINTPIQYVGDSLLFIKEAFDDLLKVHEIDEKILQACRKLNEFEKMMNSRDEVAEEQDLEFLIKEIPGACNVASEGVTKVADIVRAMKNFSHPGHEDKQLTDLNKSITTTTTVCRNEWKYVAEMELKPGDIPHIKCFHGSINQVLLNMTVNAAHAIRKKFEGSGEKGKITIATSLDNNFVIIRLSDNGSGMTPEIKDKIFEPFFTTKKVGEGTGQGLAIVHDIIVSKHNGSIDVDSSPETGTTFTIKLPLE